MKDRAAFALATWFGSGYSPVAPGTAGSLAAVVIAAGAHYWLGWGRWELLAAAALAALVGVWASGRVALREGADDPGIVVIDEVAGQWLTLAGAAGFTWKTWLAGFLLFRALDIWKPAPARRLERLHGGVGIVADDVMAGVYGAALLLAAGPWLI